MGTNCAPLVADLFLFCCSGRYKKIGLSHEMGLVDTPPSANKAKQERVGRKSLRN